MEYAEKCSSKHILRCNCKNTLQLEIVHFFYSLNEKDSAVDYEFPVMREIAQKYLKRYFVMTFNIQ